MHVFRRVKNWKAAILLSSLVLILQLPSGMLISQTIHTEGPETGELAYIPHGPISIMENQDFVDQGWPGMGTIDEPYVLEDLEIECDDETGIFVANTTAFFEVRNCRFTSTEGGMGFWLVNVTGGEVRDCVSESCHLAIWNSSQCSIESNDASGSVELVLWGCTDCSVVGNSFDSDTWDGVILDTCTNCEFVGNVVVGSEAEGIWLLRDVNCSIRENEFAENGMGIGLVGSNDTLISRNNIHDNSQYGLHVYSCGDIQMTENTFQNDGVVMHFWGWGWDGHEISGRDSLTADYVFQNNTVNGKPLGFFQDLHEGAINGDSYGQVIVLNCSGLSINQGVVSNTSIGVQILFSDNCTLTHMSIANCGEAGVTVEESNSTIVVDCTLSNNAGNGLHLERSFQALIVNNSISGSGVGLYLGWSGLCIILNNTLTSNTWGTTLYSTSDCLLVNNTVLYNKVGIRLADECNNNVIYGNSIGWNEWGNAVTENYGNQWDDGISRGNRWSDYDGSGVYEISYREVDRFPELLGGSFPYVELGLIGVGVFGVVVTVAALVRDRRSRGISAATSITTSDA